MQSDEFEIKLPVYFTCNEYKFVRECIQNAQDNWDKDKYHTCDIVLNKLYELSETCIQDRIN